MNTIRNFFSRPYLYLIVLLVGIFLKFYKIDKQFFWDDEICTILHTSGIPMNVYEENIPKNKVLHRKYFDDLIRLNNRNLKITDQFIGLAKMPQLTPGHYYYFIFLTHMFGDGNMLYRYFSLIVYLLSIPLLFLLTRKLFNSDLAAWITIGLYAVSPFFQYYAQEARYYVLWGFAIILMHYIYLNAAEKQNKIWWVWYVLFGFFAVHTTLLFYITLLAHFIYIFIYNKKQWKNVLLSQFLIFLTSLPWLIYIYINREDIQHGLEWQKFFGKISFFELLMNQIWATIDTFIRFRVIGAGEGMEIAGTWIYGVLLVIALIVLFRKASTRQIWFIVLATFLGMVAIITIDMVRSSVSSFVDRYLLLNFIGVFMLAGFALKQAIEYKPLVFGALFITIIVFSSISSVALSNDPAYYKRADAYYHVEDAVEKFAGKEKVLIITDCSVLTPKSYTTIMSLLNASSNENIDIIDALPPFPDFKHDFDINNYDSVYCMYLSDTLNKKLHSDFTADEISIREKRLLYGRNDVSVYKIEITRMDTAKSIASGGAHSDLTNL